jgi:hypothetical protein
MLAEILLKYLNGDTFDEIFFIKKNIKTSTHRIDLGQQWLTSETYNLRYEIVIKPWNPYINNFQSPIIMN